MHNSGKVTPLLQTPSFVNRFLWRLRAPATKEEVRRTERVLATARVFLAISPIVTFLFEPQGSGLNSPFSLNLFGAHVRLVWLLLAVYIAHSVLVLLLFRFRHDPAPRLIFFIHAADVAWPVLITLVAGGENGPFARFYVFVLLEAAYRWGLRETLATAGAWIVLLWGEGLWLGNIPAFAREFAGVALLIRSAYLLVMAMLIGYLAEHEKRFRAERLAQNRLLASARVELGLSGTLQAVMGEIMQLFESPRALLAAQEAHSVRLFLADVHLSPGGRAILKWREATPEQRDRIHYLECESSCSFATRKDDGTFPSVGLDESRRLKRLAPDASLEAIASEESAESVAAVSIQLAEEWQCRILLFDPQGPLQQEEDLRFLRDLMDQVGPAVYNVFLLRRLRQRAGAVERARVARDLHDGAVQSLIAMEMKVDRLRRHLPAEAQAGPVSAELSGIQQLLREEVLKLREMMQNLKSVEAEPDTLVGLCADASERFQRETGIATRFVAPNRVVDLEGRVCRELLRILQEALVNVRKHSGARNVLIRLLGQDGQLWKLIVEDDGQGFDFEGRLEMAALDEQRSGPLVIKERVRLIAGQLAIESTRGSGSRLEVSVHSRSEPIYG